MDRIRKIIREAINEPKSEKQILSDVMNLDKIDVYQIKTPKFKFEVGLHKDGKRYLVEPYVNPEWLAYDAYANKNFLNKKQAIDKIKLRISQGNAK